MTSLSSGLEGKGGGSVGPSRAPPPDLSKAHRLGAGDLEQLDIRAVHPQAPLFRQGAELLVDRLAAGAKHLGERALRQVEIDDGDVLLHAAVDDGELAEEDDEAVAEVVEDRLVDLRIGAAETLAEHEDHPAGEP